MTKVEITQYFQTENPCYKAGRTINPSGIVVHSTGANNAYIRRYVGPDDGVLGLNKYGNHWNKASANKCVHAFIGKVADGSVRIYQTLPWNYRSWGVGSGSKGSYNATHIQFEICEDGLINEEYYNQAFTLAKELCAFLCAEYDISPDNVVGHYEAGAAGYGSSHADPRNWQRKFGGSMNEFRADVRAMLGQVDETTTASKPAAKPETEPAQDTKPKETTTAQPASGVINMKILRNGNKGTQVKVLQWLLNENGFDAGLVDGIFGTNTRSAVRAYQKAKGLDVDGVVGKNTWTKLLA